MLAGDTKTHSIGFMRSRSNVQVEVADCMQTLFRGNSLASKIMAYCFRFYGQWYLCDLLSPLIQEMFHLEKESQVSYEIDHTR